MADHDDEGDHDDAHGESEEPQREWEARATAPQSPYSGRDVAVGALIALLGILVTVGAPLALTL
jgi:hypothetical protein